MVRGEKLPNVSVISDIQVGINKTYPKVILESPIQGWYYLKAYEHGIETYKTLGQPAATDEQWVGMCYYMKNQTHEAITHLQLAIHQGNGAASISLANVYLFSGHTEMVLPELEKMTLDSLSPYSQHLFLINRSQYYTSQCNLINAYSDAEMAWSLGQTLPEWPLLIARNAFILSSLHSDMGKLRSALWYLEQAVKTNEENGLTKVLLMRADILVTNGYFFESEEILEDIQPESLPEAYQPGFYSLWGHIYWGYNDIPNAIDMFGKTIEFSHKQPINRVQHELFTANLNLAILHLSQELMLKAQEHLMAAKILIADENDKLLYHFRDISLQQAKGLISIQQAHEEFEILAQEWGDLGYLRDQGRVNLYVTEMKRKMGEDIQNDLDELHCLGVAMQTPNFLIHEWVLLAELFEITKTSHPSLTGNKTTAQIIPAQHTIELEFLNHHKVSINQQTVDFPLKWCEILALLAKYPQGLSGEELLAYLYGDGGNMSTLKSALSKLRSHAPIASRPYHLTAKVKADFLEVEKYLIQGQIANAVALYKGTFLSTSKAPKIVEIREQLEETLRQAILYSGNKDLWFEAANHLGDDLEIWEHLLSHLSVDDPKYPYVLTKVKRIRRDWQQSN